MTAPEPTPTAEHIDAVATMKRGKTSAETCALNGWHVGTVIEGDEGYGPTRIHCTTKSFWSPSPLKSRRPAASSPAWPTRPFPVVRGLTTRTTARTRSSSAPSGIKLFP